ncbi:hypothetical protein EVAR_92439_1 [Eumeta japonica]|uniref:Uncharacterized protein n=1 Tax=Eumeta variegata TaxID=151549 RepID=A0A4C1T9B9_EUMVA|nr:hypothetical protein EVAR_92439_1 [Eumeta japonica]
MLSVRVRDAVYFSLWQEELSLSAAVRLRLLITMQRAGKPVIMSAGGIYDMNMESFSKEGVAPACFHNSISATVIDGTHSALNRCGRLEAPPHNLNYDRLTNKVKCNIHDNLEYFSTNEARPISAHRAVQSKVFEGVLRRAMRFLVSDGSVAGKCKATRSSLKRKHPTPSHYLPLSPSPDSSYSALSVNVKDVLNAFNTCYKESASGSGGISPHYLPVTTGLVCSKLPPG